MDQKLNHFRGRGGGSESNSGEEINHENEESIDLSSKSKLNPLERMIFSGMELNHVSSLNFGLCIPSKCSSSDIEISLKKRKFSSCLHLYCKQRYCQGFQTQLFR